MASGLKSISVRLENPESEIATRLVQEMTEEVGRRYRDLNDEGARSFKPSDVLVPRSAFVVACLDGHPAGCGALRPMDLEAAEVKRMFVRPIARRQGVGRQILLELERLAAKFEYRFLRLETGVRQPEAIALYESCGFYRIRPYGKYVGDPISLCFEKTVVLRSDGRD
jgi:GNAT superfamily N-acetyltransferase